MVNVAAPSPSENARHAVARGAPSRPNQGRVAKRRVLSFLEREGVRDADAAPQIIELLHRISATMDYASMYLPTDIPLSGSILVQIE